MVVGKSMLFVFLLSMLGAAHADLEAVVDLDEGVVITEDLASVECKKNCLEVHRIDSYMFYIMWDTEGRVLEPRLLPIRDMNDSGYGFPGNNISVNNVGHMSFLPKDNQGGTCGADRVNCVLVIRVPGGYILWIWYGPDGKIVKMDMLPAKDQQR
ncbi:hypothetical protein [Thiolapillus sp.]